MSYATLPADVVLDACQAWLDKRAEKIKRDRELMIEEAMKPMRFGPLVLRRARTHDEAIAVLSADSWSAYSLRVLEGGYWASQVENLKNLASAAIDNRTACAPVVHVSDVQASIIF